MKNTIKLIVNINDKNQRIDVFLNKNNQQISRSRIKNLILKKKLKVNDKVILNPSKKILFGDKIELNIPEPVKASVCFSLILVPTKENSICRSSGLNVIDSAAPEITGRFPVPII